MMSVMGDIVINELRLFVTSIRVTVRTEESPLMKLYLKLSIVT